MPKTQSNWANRITGTGTENPADLLANPENWRIHPREQQGAMEAALDQVGWIQSVIVNQTSGQMIDGHLRVKLAMRHGETEIPVVYVALSEAEEKLALATFDPISGMAATDQEMLQRLIDDVPEMDSELEAMLQDLMNEGHEGEEEAEYPELADGDREPFQQMTFTVHDDQKEMIDEALIKAKKEPGVNIGENDNTNGNALAYICGAFSG